MNNKGYEVAISVLSFVCLGLVIAIVAILTFDPNDARRINYELSDNEAAIENTLDYGMRQAPANAYDIVVEETELY